MPDVPRWVRPVDRERFVKPWKVSASRLRRRKFKKALWNHGYLSPNFRRVEAKCADGTDVPLRLRGKAQRHAFMLERARHLLGDRSLNPLSWFRTRAHNAAVGGASNSRHLDGDATDWARQPAQGRFNAVMRRVFKRNGIGSGGSSGNVQHVDSRGWPARWTYPGRRLAELLRLVDR